MTTAVPISVSLTIDGVAVPAVGTAEIPDPVAPSPPPSAADVAAALAATPSFVAATTGTAGTSGTNGTDGTNGTSGTSPTAASVEAILAADPNFIKAVAAAVTVSLPPVVPSPPTPPIPPSPPNPPAPPTPGAFDFYIGPTGDDTNPGTLTSPWSITALNSKQSAYAGKRIGIIGDKGPIQHGAAGGVQHTLYSLYQVAAKAAQVLVLNGGPSANQPTYLASCDSSGAYSARLAIIDASDPVTGNKPTVEAALIAQNTYLGLGPVANWGNVTVDGLTIRNFTFSALLFYGTAAAPINGLIIENCEIYDGQNVASTNNPGAIWIDGANNGLIRNNKIHDLQTNAGTTSGWALLGYIQFNSFGMKVTGCTFYNCVAVSQKDNWQQLEVSYCYLGYGTFGSGYNGGALLGATVHNYLTQTGLTNNFHHNICIGPIDLDGESSQQNHGQVNIYNNTFYGSNATSPHKMDAIYCNLGNAGGNWAFYNNLVYSPYGYDGLAASNQPATIYIKGINSSPAFFTKCDNNAYGSGITFGIGWSAGQYALPIATWKGYGFDAHSVILASNPFAGTPAEGNANSFAIAGPALTAGVGGAACGALDGSGQVGCGF